MGIVVIKSTQMRYTFNALAFIQTRMTSLSVFVLTIFYITQKPTNTHCDRNGRLLKRQNYRWYDFN